MKISVLPSILVGLAAACLAVALPLCAAPPPGYRLAWSDEFDGTVLDTSKWSHRLLGKRHVTDDLGLGQSFHIYGVEWTETEYRFFVDGRLTWTASPVSRRPQYIILSSEVHDRSWAGTAPAEGYGSLGTSRTKMVVDYVRFYERSSATETKK